MHGYCFLICTGAEIYLTQVNMDTFRRNWYWEVVLNVKDPMHSNTVYQIESSTLKASAKAQNTIYIHS